MKIVKYIKDNDIIQRSMPWFYTGILLCDYEQNYISKYYLIKKVCIRIKPKTLQNAQGRINKIRLPKVYMYEVINLETLCGLCILDNTDGIFCTVLQRLYLSYSSSNSMRRVET